MMKKKSTVLFFLILSVFCSCGKDDFYEKFVPEILYYQNADVENADFKEVSLATGVTQYTVKARVSAPMELKQIKVFKITSNMNEELIQTYDDFQLTPKVYRVFLPVNVIASETTVKILAIDQENKTSTRNFKIKVTP